MKPCPLCEIPISAFDGMATCDNVGCLMHGFMLPVAAMEALPRVAPDAPGLLDAYMAADKSGDTVAACAAYNALLRACVVGKVAPTYAEAVATETPEWVVPPADSDALLDAYERAVDDNGRGSDLCVAPRAAVRARMRPWPTAAELWKEIGLRRLQTPGRDIPGTSFEHVRAALAALAGGGK